MGVRILDSEGSTTETGAVLFDSVSGWAFGPVFQDVDEAEAFLAYLKLDARFLKSDALRKVYETWVLEGKPREEVTS